MFRNRARHLVELLNWRAAQQATQPAFAFEADEGTSTSWTYADLDHQARAVAVALLEHARPGERALLLCPAGAEFTAAFLGSLYAGVVPVAAYPPASARHVGRIAVILRDALTDLVVTTRRTRDRIEKWLSADVAHASFRFLCVDDVDAAGADLWRMPDVGPDSLAFLQYTSGSTSDPKGVMVGHGNLLANVGMIERNMHFRPGMVMVSWLPMFHDMGLIGNVLTPLYVGGRTVLMSPHAFVQAPVRWLRLITRHGGTFTGAPNFGYAICASHVTEQQKADLDLSSLTQAYCGSEPIDARVMERFVARFRSCGFRPGAFYACYGMAESTLLSTGSIPGEGSPTLAVDADELGRGQGRPSEAPTARVLVSCGYSVEGQDLRIVDPATRRPLPDGRVGEIWIRGPHVTQGYWGRPELTAEVFGGMLADGVGPFLRTGDLAFVRDGSVFVTGRIKDVIIVRGRNHYPQDVERAALASSAALNAAAAAFPLAQPGETERVVVVCEVTRQAARALDGDAVVAAIRDAVQGELELPLSSVVLIKPAALPRTSSGKIRRRATRDAYLAGTLEALHTWSAAESAADGGSAARADDAIRWLRAYAERRIDSRLIDERRTLPPYVVLDFGNHGLLGLQAPCAAGGLALTHRDLFRVFAQLAAIDMTLASFVGVHNALGLRPLLRQGSPAQLDAWLPAVAQGRQLASFAFTEPAAGSNPAAIETTARPDGHGGWVLRGSKKWIGTAAWAGVIHVFGHVLDETGARRGITGFAVREDAPGLVQGPEELTMGMRGMVQNTVYLRDVRVGPEDVLGRVGEGMEIAQDVMEFGRVCIAASAVGLMMRAGQLMARYATRRQIATGRLIDNVVSRERMTELTLETAALESLVERFAAWLDAGVDVPKACFAAVKALAAETAYRGVDRLMQMLGGRGYIETSLVPQMLRDARLLRLFEGPTETMQMFVGSRVATGGGEFLGFLRSLGGGDVAARLEALAAALSGRGEDGQQVAVRLGEAASWGFWLSAVAGAGLDREAQWLRSCFERCVTDARLGTRAPVLGRDEIEAAVAGYAARIGDLDQRRPAVLDEMDPLLRRDGASVVREEPPSLPGPEPAVVATSPPRGDGGGPAGRRIEEWMQRWIGRRLQREATAIDATLAFADLGLDSLTAVELTRDLEDAFGVSVAPTASWDFPTVRALAESLSARAGAPAPAPAPAATRAATAPAPTAPAVVRPPAPVSPAPRDAPDAIAVVGMACRFPGGASDVDTFWSLLRAGHDAVGPVPADRWDTNAFFDPDPDAPGKLYARHGAFLDDIDRFDAEFFGISPLEAGTMDPQQRVLLEVAWEALEHAAIAPDGLRGSRTGVFVGLMYQDYLARQLHELGREAIGPYLGTGSTFSAAAGRLSYILDLHGPSIAVDTACSSSLVSVHLACQSLRSGECDTALAGGVNLMVTPDASINLSKARMLSPAGRCRTFDADADGYTRGEGCGLIVLKRLSRARADGDRILGIIRGSAVNQDGRSNGLTAPNGSAQRQLMRDALAAAGARPDDVGYVECHGTGTPLGDPVEVGSVVDVFGDRSPDNPLAIGSVKTNFGHLESAAGICGLMKALLVVRHREIPPHLHLSRLNPHIDFSGRPVVIPTAPTPWFTRSTPRLAAVSAFGFVGTNAQVIVEGTDEAPVTPPDREAHVLTLSASTGAALDALADRMAVSLDSAGSLPDLCYTTNIGRARLAHRLAVAADSPRAMQAALRERPLRGIVTPGAASRVVVLFPGQGSRAAATGRRLYDREPLFRDTLDASDAWLRPHLGTSLPSLLFDDDAPLDRTENAQPALLALGHALFLLWRSWGLEPSALLGHSVGEYAAACAAGVFGIEDALSIVTARARLMQALPDGGAMAAFFAPESWAVDAIGERRGTLAVAAVNGPSEVVISGARADLQAVIERAHRQGIHASTLRVSHAFHSPLMRPMLDEFAAVLGAVAFRRPELPLVSSLTGRMAEGDEMSNADYWLRHVLAPVRFGDAIESMRTRERFFLELGPQAVLGAIVARTLDGATAAHGLAAPDALAALHVHGGAIDWAAVHRPFGRRKAALPAYPFQRKRHWLDEAPAGPAVRRPAATLLGDRLPESAHDAQTMTWQADSTRPFLRDHTLFGTPVWPIAAQIDLALSAAQEGFGRTRCHVTSLELTRTLHSDVDSVQTVLTVGGDLRIHSRSTPGGAWLLHTRARVEPDPAPGGPAAIAFSAMFFAAKEEDPDDRYRLILEAAKRADRMGFRSVWVPERHFTDMGSLYPNPSVLHAALARETTRIRLMAGSVVLPLHNPLRVAEEWAMVDNLSGGRVGLSLASGWNPHDFVLAPDKYEARYEHLYDGIDTLRRLWRGEAWQAQAPSGETVALRTYPTPVQRDLPLWITAARSPESFRKAGALGANLLTHLLDQDVETLAGKIAIYRAARADHGLDPATGQVTVMCHTFVGPDIETVHRLARRPFCDYLKASRGLLAGLAQARKQEVDLDALSGREFDEFVEFLYERFHSTRALIGTPATCGTLVDALQAAGVDEIACLLDFGPTTDQVLAHLPFIAALRGDGARQAAPHAAAAPPALDVAAIRSRCTSVVPGQRFYDELSAAGVEFAGSLRTLRDVHVGAGEALAEIRPESEGAVVVDAGVQALLAAFGERSPSGPLLVPARVRAIRLHAPLGGRARWAHVRRTSELAGSITVTDDAGEPLLDIEDLEVKRVARTVTPDLAEWLYDVRWRPLEPRAVPQDRPRPWIVLEDRRGLAAAWAARHPAAHLHLRRGAVTEAVGPGRFTVNPEGGFDELFSRIDVGAYAGILDCWPLDGSAADLEASQRIGIEAATSLVQAMARTGGGSLPRLWVVTRGVQSFDGEAPSGLFQATLWGFAAAMAREHAEWWGGIVDVSDDAEPADLDAVLVDDREDQIAVRRRQRYARRVVRAADGAPRAMTLSPEATYVVAGGQGGLGLATSGWLAQRGARRLLLLGRSPADGPALATIGADVEYRQVDIADDEALAEAFAGRDIRGLVHAAGAFHDESLLRLDHALLWQVLRARVSGAWALHRALKDARLDFFLLFSSFSGLTPPHGQAAYAAAAAFLDALAHFRRASGQPALSIDWGAWSEIGFAASDTGREAHARLEALGMRRMSPAEGLAALEIVMRRETPPQIAVMPMDLRRAGEVDPALEYSRLLADLLSPSGRAPRAAALLAPMAPQQRIDYLRGQLARIAGEVLRMEPAHLDVAVPLTAMGLDSLVAVQVKNRLHKEVGLTLPLVNALRGGTIASLADDLLSLLDLPGTGGATGAHDLAATARQAAAR